jgi:hypothetical protein
MSDATAPSKRTRKITAGLNDAGHGTFAIHTRPDEVGKQGIAEVVTLDPAYINADLIPTLALRGVADVLAVRIQRLDNPDASTIRATYDTLIEELHAGTWTPGRSFDAGEPDDMVTVLAEVYTQPVHVIQKIIDDKLAECKLAPDGTPFKDKAGRVVHLYSKAKLYASFEAEPRVKAGLARILAERAKTMAADARKGGGTASTAGAALFGTPQAAAAQ